MFKKIFGKKEKILVIPHAMQNPRVLRSFEVPEDKIEGLILLMENYDKDKGSVALFRIWQYIAAMFPEARAGAWVMNLSGGHISIQEK